MAKRLLLDMNLSPQWCEILSRHDLQAVHWAFVGDPRATDTTLMEWARTNDCIVVTHDLDFSAILAATGENGPSVIQIRSQKLLPDHLESLLVSTVEQFAEPLETDAIIVIDETRFRIRMLPLR